MFLDAIALWSSRIAGCHVTAEVRFSNWQLGEPSDPNKMCVVLSKENPWMWKTADCAEDRLRFICQKHDGQYP